MLTYINIGKFGRLGNQMFQIASTIGIAKKNNTEFSFPDWNCYYTKKNYNSFFSNSLPKLINSSPINTIQETGFNYNEIRIPTDNKLYNLSGYFQSEKYFKDYRDIIINYFSLKPEIEDTIFTKYGSILNNSCSVHIRRGDYLGQQNLHPVQTIEYYNNAIQKIYDNDLNNIKDVNFLVFSDDINWCKNNIKLPNIHYIENNLDIIDLYLMSKCDNNIIANSSFSWWGAWLNRNKNKKVIAPKKWFGQSLNHNTSDLIPDEWIKI